MNFATARGNEALDSHPLPMWIYDVRTLRIVDVNEAAIAKYGYSREAFLQRSITDLRPPEDVTPLRERIARLVSGCPSSDGHRWRHRLADASVITVDIHAR